MKIALVCPYDPARPGGVQFHIRDCAAALRRAGHRVALVSPRAGSSAPPGWTQFGASRSMNFNRTRIDVSLAWGRERRRLHAWLREEAFDVIHFHTVWDPFLPLQILAAAGSAARVATFHDTPPGTFSGRMTRRAFTVLSRILYRWLDAVIAVSSSPMGHLHKRTDRPIHLVPPFVDLGPFFAGAAPVSDGGPARVLFLGRLDARKGVTVLIEAAARLKAAGHPIRLTIAGTGEEEPALRRQVAAAGLVQDMFIGSVAEADKPALYAAHDIFCSPASEGESFGIVLTEAMASGLPVVACDNAGYRTVLGERAPDCLVPPNDPAALADRLAVLASDAELRNELGAWGRREARRHDAAAWVDHVVEIYESACGRRQ